MFLESCDQNCVWNSNWNLDCTPLTTLQLETVRTAWLHLHELHCGTWRARESSRAAVWKVLHGDGNYNQKVRRITQGWVLCRRPSRWLWELEINGLSHEPLLSVIHSIEATTKTMTRANGNQTFRRKGMSVVSDLKLLFCFVNLS